MQLFSRPTFKKEKVGGIFIAGFHLKKEFPRSNLVQNLRTKTYKFEVNKYFHPRRFQDHISEIISTIPYYFGDHTHVAEMDVTQTH